MLLRARDSPVVVLNHAVSTAMVEGLAAGLALLAPLARDARLGLNHRRDAVRAHLLERAGRAEEAEGLYRLAASKTTNIPERNYPVDEGGTAPRVA